MSIERVVVAAMKPVMQAVIAVEKRVDEIAKMEGPPGNDADPAEVAAIIVEKFADILRGVPGAKGEPGEPGLAPTPEEVAKALVEAHAEDLRGSKGEPGEAGPPLEVEEVVKALMDGYSESLKGEKGDTGEDGVTGAKGDRGDDGADADPEAIATLIFDKYCEKLRGPQGERGEPGQDAILPPIEDIVDVLAKNHYEILRGDKGEKGDTGDKGETGEPGQDAITPPSEEIAEILATDYSETLRGEKGEKGDTGEKGDKGDNGQDGSDGSDGLDGIGFDLKVWEPGVYREGIYVQHYIGKIYKALKDTSSEPGKSDEWKRIGNFGHRYVGVKKPDFIFEEGDIYIEDGTTFIWSNGKGKMWAKRGEKGPQGEKGERGEKGEPAPAIVEVVFDEGGIFLAFDNGNMLEADSKSFYSLLNSKIKDAIEPFNNAIDNLTEKLVAFELALKAIRK